MVISMRILGLDFGSKTVGVAVSDPLLLTAQGVEIVRRQSPNKLRQTLARIEEIIKGTVGKITKTELIHKCPDISQTTIQRTLNDLWKQGFIIKHGGGRYTAYSWNREND